MTLKLYTTKVECVDEDMQEGIFTVSAFDECTAEVILNETGHTLNSWKELSAAVEEAIKRLELKE